MYLLPLWEFLVINSYIQQDCSQNINNNNNRYSRFIGAYNKYFFIKRKYTFLFSATRKIVIIKALGSVLDVILYGSLYHAFLLIGGMQMMIIHIQGFTSLRMIIPCTLLPSSVGTGCFPYFFTSSFINVSAIGIVLPLKGEIWISIELLYLLNQWWWLSRASNNKRC